MSTSTGRPLPPPPVPPRPSRSVVADALARPRRAHLQMNVGVVNSKNRAKRDSVKQVAPQPPTSNKNSKTTNLTTKDISSPLTKHTNATPTRPAPPPPPNNSERAVAYNSCLKGRASRAKDPKMRSQSKPLMLSPNERRPTILIIDNSSPCPGSDSDGGASSSAGSVNTGPGGTTPVPRRSRILHSDWFEVEDGGKEVRYSTCQITIEDSADVKASGSTCSNSSNSSSNGSGVVNIVVASEPSCDFRPNQQPPATPAQLAALRRLVMASLQGLPPLPKSLSGANLVEDGVLAPAPSSGGTGSRTTGPSPPPPPPRTSRKGSTSLDTQLAILRKEMCSLRQLDLSLLGQLWSLNESIQEFRQIFQDDDQDGGAMSPGALSPDSAASSEDDEFYSLRYRPPAPSTATQVAVERLYHHSESSSRSSTVDFGDA